MDPVSMSNTLDSKEKDTHRPTSRPVDVQSVELTESDLSADVSGTRTDEAGVSLTIRKLIVCQELLDLSRLHRLRLLQRNHVSCSGAAPAYLSSDRTRGCQSGAGKGSIYHGSVSVYCSSIPVPMMVMQNGLATFICFLVMFCQV